VLTLNPIRYGIFECKACQESDNGICGDHCSGSWADDLYEYEYDELWPACKCCGAKAHLVAPLLTVES
jgi:hypothetical protein